MASKLPFRVPMETSLRAVWGTRVNKVLLFTGNQVTGSFA